MDPFSLLQTHAEVAMALAGFASVVAAIGRPLGATQRQRFLALLFLALVQVMSSLVPIWLANFVASEQAIWRIASLLSLLLATLVVVFTVFLPLRAGGDTVRTVINPFMTRVLDTTSASSILVLVLNAIGFPWEPGFVLYYASLLLAISAGFLIFADVVLSDYPRG